MGLIATGLVLAQASLLARALAGAARGTGLAALSGTIIALLLVLIARAAATHGGETAALRAARRVCAVLDAPDPVFEPAMPQPLPARLARVELRDARVRYTPDGPLALDGVDLDLAPGRRVALVGPSGAGKSTIAAVLLRFCDLAGGTATLNGRPLATYAGDDVRRLIGGCPQDPHIFDTTIGDNLRLAPPGASDDELADAAARARLLTRIRSLPDGFARPVGAHGAAISGGQRQRIALARALLADPALLILDEPAAGLERETRQALTADLLAATANRGTLLITHELDGLGQVDEVVVLDRGKVVQRGTHRQLLRSGGPYRRMHDCAAAPAG